MGDREDIFHYQYLLLQPVHTITEEKKLYSAIRYARVALPPLSDKNSTRVSCFAEYPLRMASERNNKSSMLWVESGYIHAKQISIIRYEIRRYSERTVGRKEVVIRKLCSNYLPGEGVYQRSEGIDTIG